MLDLLPPNSVDPRDKFCIMLLERLDDLSDKYFNLQKELKEMQDNNVYLTQKLKLLDIPKNVINFKPLYSNNINIIIYLEKQETDKEIDFILEIVKHLFELTNSNKEDMLRISKMSIQSNNCLKFEIMYQCNKVLNVMEILHNLNFPTIKQYRIENDDDTAPKFYRNYEHVWTFMGTYTNLISER